MVRIWHKFLYLIQETSRSFRSGGWMNWAAICTLTLMLFLLGISYLVHFRVSDFLEQMDQILELTAYLKPDTDPQSVQGQISLWQGIENVRIVGKETAWQQILADLGQSAPEAEALLGGNPLLDSLKISPNDTALIPQLSDRLLKLETVETVWYGQELIQQLEQLQQGLNQFSWWGLGILISTALAVTYTTIRLVILSRSVEIEIMHLVGASVRWVYAPFLIQGFGFGVLATIFATGLLWLSSQLLTQMLLPWGISFPSISLEFLPLILLGFGTLVSTIGSWFSLSMVKLK